jgi:hypothetical protein
LLPSFVAGVVVVEALACTAFGAGPAFEDDAVIEDAFDRAVADLGAIFRGDGPVADPEVEGAMGRVGAGMEDEIVLREDGLEARGGA